MRNTSTVTRFADGHFNLRDALTASERRHEFAQRHDEMTDGRRQHLARGHVGDVAALLFAEPHQHPALFHDIVHGEAGAGAVAPWRAADGRRICSGITLPMRSRLSSSTRCVWPQIWQCKAGVLHGAPAAQPEEFAARLDAIRALFQDL